MATARATAPDPCVAAFFDLDNTVVRGASLFYFARGLHARGFFSSRELRGFARRAVHFALRG